MDAFLSGQWHHYIIVEFRDFAVFKHLATSQRTVIVMESILPTWLRHLASPSLFKNRSLWYSFRTGFMIGWQVQQLVKMKMAFNVSDAGLVYCDSDVFFIRPFDVASMQVDGKFRFYRTDHAFKLEDSPNRTYLISSARHLGLGSNPFPSPSYIDNIVAWHRDTAVALCQHIEDTSGGDWMVTLGRRYIISEYSLYGLFVDRVIADHSHLRGTGQNLCKTVWHGAALTGGALDKFCDGLDADHVAVGFQSFVGVSTEELNSQLQRAIDRHA
jgi:Family of unknown function (DUF6492)